MNLHLLHHHVNYWDNHQDCNRRTKCGYFLFYFFVSIDIWWEYQLCNALQQVPVSLRLIIRPPELLHTNSIKSKWNWLLIKRDAIGDCDCKIRIIKFRTSTFSFPKTAQGAKKKSRVFYLLLRADTPLFIYKRARHSWRIRKTQEQYGNRSYGNISL